MPLTAQSTAQRTEVSADAGQCTALRAAVGKPLDCLGEVDALLIGERRYPSDHVTEFVNLLLARPLADCLRQFTRSLRPTRPPSPTRPRSRSRSPYVRSITFCSSTRSMRALYRTSPDGHQKTKRAALSTDRTTHWSGWGDLNSRPPRPERGALPSCATPRSDWGCYPAVAGSSSVDS